MKTSGRLQSILLAGRFVADGDSITAGVTNGTSYFAFLTYPTTRTNVGVSGYTTTQMISTGSKVDTLFVPGVVNVVAVLGGTNDCGASTAAATIWANLSTYSAARKAAGFKTVVLTMPSFYSAAFDPCHDALNALIRPNWPGVFDAIADIAADPNIGADGAYANFTYFTDGTHPTTFAQQTIIEPIVQTAINSLF